MTQQPGSSYVDATAGSQGSGYQTDAERFPDPKRNWKRTGSLLGGWAGAWIAVFVLGIGWNLLGSGLVEEDPDEIRGSAYTAISGFFEEALKVTGKPDVDIFTCADYTRPTVNEIRSVFDEYKDSAGDFPDTEIHVPESEIKKLTQRVNVEVNPGPTNPQMVTFTASSELDGNEYCVNSVDFR